MWGESFANRPDEGETAMEPLTHFQEDVLADLLQSLHMYTRKCQNSEHDRENSREVGKLPPKWAKNERMCRLLVA